jgi:hypothetical protein
MANLVGFTAIIGKSAKQITKHASAPRLHPVNNRIRSHLLTGGYGQYLDHAHVIEDEAAVLHITHGPGNAACREWEVRKICDKLWKTGDLHANQPSSSSLLLGAGRGAPAPSVVGSLTCPSLLKGLSDVIDDKRPLC